jgi:hypothetical protein
MKLKATLITISIGLIILSLSMLIKEPAYGRANLGIFCEFMKNATPVLMFVSCLLIMLSATKLRILSILGVALIIGSLVLTYILAENTGYSMGTSGWTSGFVSILVIVPAGLCLCCVTGFFSLIDMFEKEGIVKKPVIISAAVILILGIAYHVAADWKPNIHTIVEAIKNDENKYKRFSLAVKLTEIQDDNLPSLLIPLLKDKNPRIREAAALALGGKSRSPTAFHQLLKALDRETDEKTKKWIIRSLSRAMPVADPEDGNKTVETLIQILKTEKSPIKRTAAEALGVIKDERAIRPLIEALTDEDAGWAAHNSLIMITNKRFKQDPDVWNRWMNRKTEVGSPDA